MASIIGVPEIIMSLLQGGMSLNAPYNAAKAQTYATKDTFNNLSNYRAINNASQPKMFTPYQTIDDATGKTVWHAPALSASGPMSSQELDPNYLTKVWAQQTNGARTSMPNKQPGLINSLISFGQ